MKILSTLQSWLPEMHNYTDDDRRHHIGITWRGKDGLRDSHDLELKYTYNSERLALQGSPCPERNWAYTYRSYLKQCDRDAYHNAEDAACKKRPRGLGSGTTEPIALGFSSFRSLWRESFPAF